MAAERTERRMALTDQLGDRQPEPPPLAQSLYVVRVHDDVDERISPHGGASYASPPQSRDAALALIGVLLGGPSVAADDGYEWTRAIAGGRRTMTLSPVADATSDPAPSPALRRAARRVRPAGRAGRAARRRVRRDVRPAARSDRLWTVRHRTSRDPCPYLRLYLEAGARYGIDPWILAGIGAVETDHGRSTARCVRSGVNAYGCRAGPMQFSIIGKPSTWDRYGRDGNHNGHSSPYEPADAIPAAARYLHSSGAPPTTTPPSSLTTTPTGTSPKSSPKPPPTAARRSAARSRSSPAP